MPGAFPVIYEIVDPSFKHRLIFLHLLSCYLDEDQAVLPIPSGIASISGPMTVTFPSITSAGGQT